MYPTSPSHRSLQTSPVYATKLRTPVAPARHEHRERDFGIGYGNSSGYASNRRYASNWGASRFRCA